MTDYRSRLPFSYNLCTTRQIRHSFSLDYSARVSTLHRRKNGFLAKCPETLLQPGNKICE